MNNTFSNLFLTFIATVFTGILLFVVAKFVLIGLSHTITLLVATLWTPIFLVFLPTATAVLALAVVLLPHPVHGLLSLISVFFSVVVLYLSAGAEFLAFTFLIVYVGAIAILFLFVIMLLNVKELTSSSKMKLLPFQKYSMAAAAVAFISLIGTLSKNFVSVLSGSDRSKFASEFPSIDALTHYVRWEFTDILVFGDLLYTYYSFLFMLIALLLLTAMLGAIVLATSTTGTPDSDSFRVSPAHSGAKEQK